MGQTEPNSQFFIDFCRFLLIFAFPVNNSISEARIFAENRSRRLQETAEFCRNPFVPFSLSLLIPPYFPCPAKRTRNLNQHVYYFWSAALEVRSLS